MKDTYKHSHFGVYGLLTDPHQNAVLLIKKSRGPYTGLLDLPGGTPESGEKPEQTLKREIREETGAEIADENLIGELDVRYSYFKDNAPGELHHTGLIYSAQISSLPNLEALSPDSQGCKWVSLDQLGDQCTPAVHAAVEFSSMAKKKVENNLIEKVYLSITGPSTVGKSTLAKALHIAGDPNKSEDSICNFSLAACKA